MVGTEEKAKKRLDAHIRPYEESIEKAQGIIESGNWDDIIESSELIQSTDIIVEDFTECVPFSSIYDSSVDEIKYASRIGNIGILIPEDRWDGKFTKQLANDNDIEAFHIESSQFTGPLSQTGLSFAKSNSKEKTASLIHESMHATFSKYSEYYEEKKGTFENSRTTQQVLDSGIEYLEIDIVNELNSFRSEENISWENVRLTLNQKYVPEYKEEYIERGIMENVYGVKYKNKDETRGEKKMRSVVKRVVDKAFLGTEDNIDLACNQMKNFEANYSQGLISHILYNCSTLEDLIGFEENSRVKSQVLQSLEVYSSKDPLYKKAYVEAKEKF